MPNNDESKKDTSSSPTNALGGKLDRASEDSNKGTSSSPTNALSGKLDRTSEIEKRLKKMEILLDIARRCNIDIDKVDSPAQPAQPAPAAEPQTNSTAHEWLMSAFKKFYTTDPDLDAVYDELSKVDKILTDAPCKRNERPHNTK